ncbi:MAG: metallophosphoesterase [Selenomonadaceae bacterium]|nr:metallophosphoesterase [Selenomonadaceae bacterium]
MFLVTLSGILALILALALVSVNFLCAEERRARLYKFFIGADLLVVAGMIVTFALRNFLSNHVVDFLGSFVTVFILSQLICGALVVLALIVRAIYRKFHKPAAFSPSRRRALRWGLLYPLMGLAVSLYGNRIERMKMVDRRFEIPVNKLPPELQGLRIAQISDIHLGAYFSLERLESLLQRIADAQPDLLAITGDIFDDNSMNDKAIRLVDSFTDKFKYGIYYCHGNHEHFRGIERIEERLAKTKIHALINGSAQVASNLYVAGVDYPPAAPIMKSGGRGDLDEKFFAQMKEYLDKALEKVPYDANVILLAHHPEFFDAAVNKKIPLTLAGHTHACQVWGLHLLGLFKYTYGMFQREDSFLYVHSGCGSWFPFRLGLPPEIAWFTLRTS